MLQAPMRIFIKKINKCKAIGWTSSRFFFKSKFCRIVNVHSSPAQTWFRKPHCTITLYLIIFTFILYTCSYLFDWRNIIKFCVFCFFVCLFLLMPLTNDFNEGGKKVMDFIGMESSFCVTNLTVLISEKTMRRGISLKFKNIALIRKQKHYENSLKMSKYILQNGF